MTRTYRGAMYEIEIEKPEGMCRGRERVILDGEELAGNVLPPQGDRLKRSVRVVVRRATECLSIAAGPVVAAFVRSRQVPAGTVVGRRTSDRFRNS